MYEVEDGVYKITVPVTSPKPVEEYLKAQGRYSHLFLQQNAAELEIVKKDVEDNYKRLERLSQLTSQIYGPRPDKAILQGRDVRWARWKC